MKSTYRVDFLNSVSMKENWPINVLGTGQLRVKCSGNQAVGLEIVFEGEPATHGILKRPDGTFTWNDDRWIEVRKYLGRVKFYLQCFAEVDFEPIEVRVTYEAEDDIESEILLPESGGMLVMNVKKEHAPRLDHELVGAACLAAEDENVPLRESLSDLVYLSRRFYREARYADAFRYGFLLIDYLYGKGEFRTGRLTEKLKRESDLVSAIRYAREHTTLGFSEDERVVDSALIIAGSGSVGDIIHHLVRRRGYYFHGEGSIAGRAPLDNAEERVLCRFMLSVIERVMMARVGGIWKDASSFERYRKNAQSVS